MIYGSRNMISLLKFHYLILMHRIFHLKDQMIAQNGNSNTELTRRSLLSLLQFVKEISFTVRPQSEQLLIR